MAKSKKFTAGETISAGAVGPGDTVEVKAKLKSQPATAPVYAFPSRSRCPRCGSESKATSTQGDVQYRLCLAPVCRNRFKVHGAPNGR